MGLREGWQMTWLHPPEGLASNISCDVTQEGDSFKIPAKPHCVFQGVIGASTRESSGCLESISSAPCVPLSGKGQETAVEE